MREFIKRAQTSGPLGQIVGKCVSGGSVISSKLIDSLKAAGYSVEFEEGKVGYYARVFKPTPLIEGESVVDQLIGGPEKDLIAFGYSNTQEDAIAQAMWGAVREEEAGIVTAIPTTIAP